MKFLSIIIFLLSFISICHSQDSLNQKWILSLDFGIQTFDKRLYDFPPKEELLKQQTGLFGTYQLAMNLKRELVEWKKIKVYGGIGGSIEINKFNRPFDINYKKSIGPDILAFTHRNYNKYLFQGVIQTEYKISKKVSIKFDVLSQFNIKSIINTPYIGKDKFIWNEFYLYSIEFNPGINYSYERFIFGAMYRAFQVKKIDKIIFNRIIRDPRTDQNYEIHNPFKMWLSVGYRL
ncbi:MAG: hypothetical protein ACI9LN_004697 [Saprospiraceae bacterium]|jgi:hypothetical protein